MDEVEKLSAAQCILLASALASAADVAALNSMIPLRLDVFDEEIVYRILLTFLPESINPSVYVDFVESVSTGSYTAQEDARIDTNPVKEVSEQQARKRIKKLHLSPLRHSSVPQDAEVDALALFLINRVHRVEEETGMLAQAPTLVSRFLQRSQYLRTWFVSSVLPLLRMNYTFYPQNATPMLLRTFEGLEGAEGIQTLLSRAEEEEQRGLASADTVGRDLRGLVGPWVCGSNQRKRRRLDSEIQETAEAKVAKLHITNSANSSEPKMDLTDWQHTFNWITLSAANDLSLAVKAIQGWNGPEDIDFGDYGYAYDTNDGVEELHTQYCQAAFAAIYTAEQDKPATIDGAHSILVRLADLLGFIPPPELATSIELLPRIEHQSKDLKEDPITLLQRDRLLDLDHPLTTPKLETFSLLQMFVYSAYLFAAVGYRLSVAKIAKLRFWGDEPEQFHVLQRIINGLYQGVRRDEDQWAHIRDVIRWLKDWNLETRFSEATSVEPGTPGYDDGGSESETNGNSPGKNDYGVLAKVDRVVLEKEILRAFCNVGHFPLIRKTYLSSAVTPLSRDEVEETLLELVIQYYDNASNGSRKRGGVKKASDIIAYFRDAFPESQSFRCLESLITATHALSYYSLTLQQGVPFQPVSIRVNDDPIALISIVLEQNPKSYTKLDDLIAIARNLSISEKNHPTPAAIEDDEPTRMLNAERRVTGMAIEAALAEDDFETAYSYVVNRLDPSPSDSEAVDDSTVEDDVSWRAAYLAGRHRSRNASTASAAPQQHLRRLEQRMDLLSQSLLLAPPRHLPEVLAAWRRCEEELLAQLAQESAAEEEFDERADGGRKRVSGVPGGFGGEPVEALRLGRNDAGRGYRGAEGEAPMRLFDIARGAAAAWGRSGRGGGRGQSRSTGGISVSAAGDPATAGAGERVRKRDVVANAVTGGLASGIGWVLGATPVTEAEQER